MSKLYMNDEEVRTYLTTDYIKKRYEEWKLYHRIRKDFLKNQQYADDIAEEIRDLLKGRILPLDNGKYLFFHAFSLVELEVWVS